MVPPDADVIVEGVKDKDQGGADLHLPALVLLTAPDGADVVPNDADDNDQVGADHLLLDLVLHTAPDGADVVQDDVNDNDLLGLVILTASDGTDVVQDDVDDDDHVGPYCHLLGLHLIDAETRKTHCLHKQQLMTPIHMFNPIMLGPEKKE